MLHLDGMETANLEEFDKAIKLYDAAIEIYHKVKNEIGILAVVKDKCRVLCWSERLNDALSLCEQHGSPLDIQRAEILELMGHAAIKNKEYRNALSCYDHALEIYNEYDNNEYIAKMHINIANTHISLRDYHKAEKQINQLRRLGYRLEHGETLIFAYAFMGTVRGCTGDPISSKKWMEKALAALEQLKKEKQLSDRAIALHETITSFLGHRP